MTVVFFKLPGRVILSLGRVKALQVTPDYIQWREKPCSILELKQRLLEDPFGGKQLDGPADNMCNPLHIILRAGVLGRHGDASAGLKLCVTAVNHLRQCAEHGMINLLIDMPWNSYYWFQVGSLFKLLAVTYTGLHGHQAALRASDSSLSILRRMYVHDPTSEVAQNELAPRFTNMLSLWRASNHSPRHAMRI